MFHPCRATRYWLRATRCHAYGAGKMLGGVKKVSTDFKTDYTKWKLTDDTRTELLRVIPTVHPLIWEYVYGLHVKYAALLKCLEGSTTGKTAEEVIKENFANTFNPKVPFSYAAWQRRYQHEVDETAETGAALRHLNDSIVMYADVSKGGASEEDKQELLEMCSDEIDGYVEHLQGRSDTLRDVIRRRLEAADVLGSSSRTWIVDVVGKAGGVEASLFAEELKEIVRGYATHVHEWRVENFEEEGSTAAVSGGAAAGGSGSGASASSVGSAKLRITGDGVYHFLRHEIGVHKVQRVPVTDHDGKMQTSTAAVTMMPVLDPVAVDVQESDCKIEFVRGSGPGGQGMQSSSNCCVLTHKPSGISVKCHQSRSALGNKELALQLVAQQILAKRVREQQSSKDVAWANQWSSGERSEKMRTYNFPQNRVTEHRIGKDFPLTSFMEGRALWKELHDTLNEADEQQTIDVVLRRYLEGDFGSDL